jgi:hypothetical protein
MIPIRIGCRTTTKQTIAELRADAKQAALATVQALNRTAEQLRTAAGGEIRAVYNIKLAAVRKASQILRAHRGQGPHGFRAEVIFSGRKIALGEFDAREKTVRIARRGKSRIGASGRKRRGKLWTRKAVTVRIKVGGDRKLVAGGFLATLGGAASNAGFRGVAKRTSRDRYPIRFLRSLSIPSALEHKAITAAILKLADNRYEINLDAALRYQIGRSGDG